MIKDSGNRREFKTGAVRDISDGKGRCDLLPLKIIGEYFDGYSKHDKIWQLLDDYIQVGSTVILLEVLDIFCKNNYNSCRETMFLEVSKHYEAGCQKYGDRNWEKGIPLHCFIDSAVRHYLKHLRGDKDEPHDRAFVWNILGALWTHVDKPKMIDLPFKEVIDNG